ncbi:MAG: PQQ-dependent sugar dehydrogenase [Ignavibacteriae bacterium]|nr:PQQ-dependent sugar dehydrogenase [Ignavibacteriota bacterium]
MKYFSYIFLISIIVSLVSISCKNETTLAQPNISKAFPNLTFENPVDIQSPDDNTDRIFVVSQKGKILSFENNQNVQSANLFLDLEEKVLFGGEQGLLGLAFHPNYKSNGKFFVNYTTSNPRRTIVSSFNISSDINKANPNSEEILLEVEQPFSNHNGGQIAFGLDGYLYISFGDGGSGGDPGNRAQNLKDYLGKILRIDVDKNENGKLYGIPIDNPFAENSEGFLKEIFAYGLRNVWRFSFDSKNNFWAADVGQNAWEEINLIEKGGNYGWRIMEGFHCYNPSEDCDRTGLKLPIHEYGHVESGGYSVTGGFVYEKNDLPELNDKYVYADFVTGNIWTFDLVNNRNNFLAKFNGQISTFGIDQNNNLYFADYSSGSLYKFVGENLNSIDLELPNRFELYQNYPNPFNPNTTISYSIPNNFSANPQLVNLNIYDLLGREVQRLVNELKSPGNYETNFVAEDLSSGVYYYKLTSGNFSQTKKMILLN